MGGEGVHIVETHMFCTVCLKSSCLLIYFHSWSLDLYFLICKLHVLYAYHYEFQCIYIYNNHPK
jgi:hypothetical protein